MDQRTGQTGWHGADELEHDDPDVEIDRELQAAIEYKIAVAGLGGVERVLHFVNVALSRKLGDGSEAAG